MAKTASGLKPRVRPLVAKQLSQKGDGRTLRTPLMQNPHAVRDTREKVLEVAIGREVRAFRKKLGITVADLAAATDISLGMLSKIEIGRWYPTCECATLVHPAAGTYPGW